jgi:hypothetical protein
LPANPDIRHADPTPAGCFRQGTYSQVESTARLPYDSLFSDYSVCEFMD